MFKHRVWAIGRSFLVSLVSVLLIAGVSACGGGGGGGTSAPSAPALAISTLALPAGLEGHSYSATLRSSAGAGTAHTWSITAGTLPAGLSLNPTSGVISGTPAAGSAATANLTVSLSAGSATAARSLSLVVRNDAGVSAGLSALAGQQGGMNGAGLVANGMLYARAISEADGSGLAGVGVCINGPAGELLTSATTDVNGDALLSYGEVVPASVTFANANGIGLFSFFGNDNAPLREFVVASFPVADAPLQVDVTLNGLTAGRDLRVTINGTIVHTAENNQNTSDTFNIATPASWEAIAETRDGPWLMLVQEFQNDADGTFDSDTLLATSYAADPDGIDGVANAVTITVDHSAGTGSDTGSTGNVSYGTASTATTSGTVTTPSPNVLSLTGALPNFTMSINNAFGSWNFTELLFDLQNPNVTSTSFPYSFDYPDLPEAVPGMAWTDTERTVQAVVISASTLANLPTDPSQIQDIASLLGIPLLIRRVTTSGVTNADISLTSFGPSIIQPVGTSTAFMNVTSDAISNGSAGVTAVLVSKFDANTYTVSLGQSATSAVNFTTVTRSGGTSPTDSWLLPFNLNLTQLPTVTSPTLLRSAVKLASPVSGSGSTGSDVARVNVDTRVRAGNTITANITSPATGTTTIPASNATIAWTGGGLTPGDGVFTVSLGAPVVGGIGTDWQILLNSASVSSGSSYSLRLPTLPTTGAFVGKTLAAGLTVSVLYVDLKMAGLDPDDVTFADVAGITDQLQNLDSAFVPDALEALPNTFILFYMPTAALTVQ